MSALVEKTQGNALEKIEGLIKIGNMASQNGEILSHVHLPGNEALHTHLLAVIILKQAPFYGKLIRQGCKEGVFQTEAPLECAEFILSGIQFLSDRGIYAWEQKDLSRRANAFPRLIEQQLKAPARSFEFMKKYIHT